MRSLVAVLLALALLAMTACGGGSSSRSGGSGRAGGGSGAAPIRKGGPHSEKPGSLGSAGGGNGSPIGHASGPTFVRNADRVCRAAHHRLVSLGRQLFGLAVAASRKRLSLSDYFAQAAALTATSGRVAGRAIVDLRALPRPADRRIEQYLALSAMEAGLVGMEADALRRHDRQRVHRLDVQVRGLVARSHSLARAVGFHSCGGT